MIFNVTAVTADSDDLESADSGEESSHVGESSEAIDPETGLPSAESVIAAFEEKVSFIQDDPAFSSFLSTYSGAMFKKYYLQADTAHTEEQWESMKEIERFCYNITYYSPYIAMMNYEFSSADEMIDELVAEKNILSQIENGDIVYDAIVEVWKWHYDYWQHTGTFCNFYNNYNDDINAGEPTASETVKLTDEDKNDRDKEEIEEIKNEIQSELAEENTENGNSAADWFKDNWLIVTILLVVVIAFLAVFLYKRSKNISGKTEK